MHEMAYSQPVSEGELGVGVWYYVAVSLRGRRQLGGLSTDPKYIETYLYVAPADTVKASALAHLTPEDTNRLFYVGLKPFQPKLNLGIQ